MSDRAFFGMAMASAIAVTAVPFACTRQQTRDVADTISDLADEVCVAGDSVSVCLRKCQAAEAGRVEKTDADR